MSQGCEPHYNWISILRVEEYSNEMLSSTSSPTGIKLRLTINYAGCDGVFSIAGTFKFNISNMHLT